MWDVMFYCRLYLSHRMKYLHKQQLLCNRFGFIGIVVLTLHIHIIVFSMCHSCDIMNYLTMWLFHVHNDNDISHITDVTISCATMVIS